jgi:hypothetical protein
VVGPVAAGIPQGAVMSETQHDAAAPLAVYLTVDVEVWPVHAGGWPHVPLATSDDCRRELDAYLMGRCEAGRYGLPYQLDQLRASGLLATFFVDPMFSFALGLEPLCEIVRLIQSAGQRVELHLHPEWLTDPRSVGLPDFRGPLIGDYPEETQTALLEIGLARLAEAGASEIKAFRAGSWGGRLSTLRAVRNVGLSVDASLNAHYTYSLDDLPGRLTMQAPGRVDSIIELPMTRFNDGRTTHGRPLSVVGVSIAESTHVLDSLQRTDSRCAALVLHSNEFVRTENLWNGSPVVPRRWIVRRFEKLCAFLAANSQRMPTQFVADVKVLDPPAMRNGLVRSGLARSLGRMVGQAVSRWY